MAIRKTNILNRLWVRTLRPAWRNLATLPPVVLVAMGVVVILALGAIIAVTTVYVKPIVTGTPVTPPPGISGPIVEPNQSGADKPAATAEADNATKKTAKPTPPPAAPRGANNTGNNAVSLNVTGVSIEVSPPSSLLSPVIGCSQDFTFTGVISVSGSGTVKYQWERNDGTVIPGSLTFTGSGSKTITDVWKVSNTSSGSQHLKITSPNNLTSNEASYNFVKTPTC